MHIEFLHQNIYGVGGTVRSVINLANALSDSHRVTITSVFRRVESPSLTISPSVTIRPLVDLRPQTGADRGDVRHNRVSRVVPPAEEYFRQYSELTDERIISHLRSSQADVIVGTRPSLNLLVAEFGREDATLVAQEHMTHAAIPRTVVRRMRELYGRLELVTAVTEADRSRIVQSLDLPDERVRVLANSVPTPELPPSSLDTRLVYAVGRLAPEKRYDLLLEAFAAAVRNAPDWRLRLYGEGPSRRALEHKASRLGVRSQVDFMGATSDMESEWPRASLLASTSERESFGMSIVEAMRNGVPVVSTDCPDGPREIITHNSDGVLVPLGQPQKFSHEMTRLMTAVGERRSLGLAALRTGERYSPTAVAERFVRLLHEAGARRSLRSTTAEIVGVAKSFLRASRRGHSQPAKITVSARTDSSVSVSGAPDGAFWKNARGARVPLDPEGAVAPGGLSPGIWNLHAPVSSSTSRRLRVSLIDAAHLVSPDAEAFLQARDRLRWTIPYRTHDGFAAVKVWDQPRHAELSSIDWSGDDILLSCTLIGAWDENSSVVPVISRTSALAFPHQLDPHPYSENLQIRVNDTVLRSLWLRRTERLFIGMTQDSLPTSPAAVAAVMSDIPDLRRRRRFTERQVEDHAPFELYHSTPARRLYIQPEFARDNALTIQLTER